MLIFQPSIVIVCVPILFHSYFYPFHTEHTFFGHCVVGLHSSICILKIIMFLNLCNTIMLSTHTHTFNDMMNVKAHCEQRLCIYALDRRFLLSTSIHRNERIQEFNMPTYYVYASIIASSNRKKKLIKDGSCGISISWSGFDVILFGSNVHINICM